MKPTRSSSTWSTSIRPTSARTGRPLRARVQRSICLLGCLALLACANAQNLAAAATEDSVLLRWSLPDDVLPPNGFVLERRAVGDAAATTSWHVAAPMQQDEAVARGLVPVETYALLTQVFSPTYQDADADVTRAFLTLSTLAHPDWARALGTLWEDGEVQPGTRYEYRVSLARPDGSAGATVGTASVTAGAVVALPPVRELDARFEAGAVRLTWARPDEASLVTAYDVYRRDEGSAERKLNDDPYFVSAIDPDAARPDDYVDEDVTAGGRYVYRVVGIDLFGRRAPSSEPLTVTVPDFRPLETLAVTSDEVLDNAIRLHWNAPTDARTRGVAVLRATDAGATPRQITFDALPPDATTYTDTTVEGGVQYYYALAAVDEAGRLGPLGPLWSQRGANFDPPSAPTGLTVVPAEDHLHLEWTASPERDVVGYRVYAGPDPDAALAEYRFLVETAATAYDLPVAKNTLRELHFKVVAVNSTSIASAASRAASGTLIDATAPAAPTMRRATVEDGAITVSWILTGDPDVLSFQLFRSEADGTERLLADALPADTDSYRDSDVVGGVAYAYSVRAVDASGNVSEASRPEGAQAIDLSGPGTPGGLSARLAEDRAGAAAGSGAGVELSWQAISGADVRGYVVERARGDTAAFLEITDVLDGDTYLDSGGRVGDRYRVLAVDAEGRVGTPSEPVAVTLP